MKPVPKTSPNSLRHALLLGAAIIGFTAPRANAELLFNSFLTPSFIDLPNTEYSKWDFFTSANGGANTPDAASPPSAPPTITQTNPGAAILSTGTNNIYGLSDEMNFVLADSTSYAVGTVGLQLQFEGAEIDLSQVKLVYAGGEILASSLTGANYIREYRPGGTQGGFFTRIAIEWDLPVAGITSYQIVIDTPSHTSLQEALLDTSQTVGDMVPKSSTWTTNGAGTWGASSSVTNGNMRFQNTGSTTATLDGSRTVGETAFEGGNTTIAGGSGIVLTSNTGIVAAATTNGVHTVSSNYAFGAMNLFEIGAGTTVRMNGAVSGAYGLVKQGQGILELNGANTFSPSSGSGITIFEGTVRISGTNNYSGNTTVTFGTLILANDATAATKSLGNGTNVVMGADATQFSGTTAANFYLEGDRLMERDLLLLSGAFVKRIGAMNTTNGATYNSVVKLGTSTNVTFEAVNETDKVSFTKAMTGGAATEVSIGGQGVVEYKTVNQIYGGATTVLNGSTWRLTSGYTGNGNVTVNSGGELNVNGTLSGTGTLALSGGKLTGTGTVSRSFTIDAGDVLSPGNSVGTLTVANNSVLTLGSGGRFEWEINDADAGTGIGTDFLSITGSLNITASSASPFTIDINSLTVSNTPGLVNDFNPLGTYDWVLLTASGGITGFDATDFALDLTGFTNSYTGTFSVVQNANSLVLHYAVPEPSRMILLAGALTSLFFRRRRK